MRRNLGIGTFLLSLILLSSMASGLLTIVFETGVADSYFEAHCINKEKEELACHGQCHLHKQIEQTSDESSAPANGVKLSFDRDYTLANLSFDIISHNTQQHSFLYAFEFETRSLDVNAVPPEC